MKLIATHSRKVAFLFLMLMLMQSVVPTVTYALTSGPSQPEMQGFQPVGNSNMVDLFSGDFTYNVPLLDVGGYPVNLAYHSGASLDDEASWVGYGWSLNVGSINRQLRGLPDDFNGTEQQERQMNIKDHITKSGKLSVTLDLLGIPVPRINKTVKKKKLNLVSPTISLGLKTDNYRGIGVEIGANTGLGLTSLTAGDKNVIISDTSNFGGSLGLNLSSFDGATINASIAAKNIGQSENTSSKSVGFGYNTRAGLTGLTLDLYKPALSIFSEKFPVYLSSSSISFNSPTYTPTIEHPRISSSYSFTMHLGVQVLVAFTGLGVTGSYSKQSITERTRKLPSYGFLYSDKGKNDPYALMDMNREKDIPYSSKVNYIPIPVPTYDLFSATSQDGSGQYRVYRGSSGVYFDPRTETKSKNTSAGIEIGGGTYFITGGDLYHQSIFSKTEKWTKRNNLLSKADFQNSDSKSIYETAYFKRVGESVPAEREYLNKLAGNSPLAGVLSKSVSDAVSGAEITDYIRTRNSKQQVASLLKRSKRETRNTTFSYLTAQEAASHALDKSITNYKSDTLVTNDCSGGIRSTIPRVSAERRKHHISEITITNDEGKRSVYGIPVYNTYQEEVSFSISQDNSKRAKGLIGYTETDASVNNKKGRENYYSKEITKPYASSYLLTAVLSPDYIDRTGNGVTDDDLGTAIKFKYTKLDSLYKWRTPYASSAAIANYNEGFLSDQSDDKANYVYGEKEVWYLQAIESKTMVAQFIMGDRDDALGVQNSFGAVDTSTQLKYLKQIRLYSKSDLQQHGNNPNLTTPIKVVHFEYNYSICRGLPNSKGNKGKLTLEKVYFTFADNNRGKLNPYKFSYDTASYNQYDYRQYDRWGNFKDASSNPGGLSNSEFPYTLQDDTARANRFVSIGQLNKILLPSGGEINVRYESDDYAYVQDKRASQMVVIKGVNANGDSTGLIQSEYLYVDLPVPVNESELKERYFEDMKHLYFKVLMDLDGLGHKEFVPGYALLKGFSATAFDGSGKVKTVRIQLEKMGGKNAIAKTGWQFLRMNLPKYAYPVSDNFDTEGGDLRKSIDALVGAFASVKELFISFEKSAERKGYCNRFDKSKSWVRLCAPDKRKLGGGLRVKRVDISDHWAEFVNIPGAQTATYSQIYDYTTRDEKGRVISSGVASYEPLMGNDENPFRQPVPYKQKQFLALDNYYYIEEPFGESFYPVASVGYSKVSVKSIGTGEAETANNTGTTVSEFYTAKDYPTKVDILTLDKSVPVSSKILKLIGGVSLDMIGLSQGYSIELNDMHGKPKSERIYNRSNENISSIEYFYKTANEFAAKKELSNDVKVVDATGKLTESPIGLDVETFTDMRQQTTDNMGTSIKFSTGAASVFFFPLPFVFPGVGLNYERISYRASSTVKIVNRFAIQYKVRKIQDGSSVTVENLLWDAETGNVLLTKTQNEFDDPVYSFAYPAHWVNDGMGMAYRNLGAMLSDFSTNTNGELLNSTYNSVVVPGDELIDINSSNKFWVVRSAIGSNMANRVIDQSGQLQQLNNLTVKLLRSGRRNMANTSIATISSLENPIVGDRITVSALTKVLDAKATVFNEEWSMPVYCASCPQGYTLSDDGAFCIQETVPTVNEGCFTACRGDELNEYSGDGALIYDTGYAVNGSGDSTHIFTSFWTSSNCNNQLLNLKSSSSTLTKSSTYDSSGSNNMMLAQQESYSLQTLTSECLLTPNPYDPSYTCRGPLNRTGIWSCKGNSGGRLPMGEWIGLSRCVSVPTSKIYYIGIAGDNKVQVKVNGQLKVQLFDDATKNFIYWHIFPIYLERGTNVIQIEAWNSSSYASFGAEIYDNTPAQLQAATSYSSLNLLFSTRDVVGQELQVGKYTCPQGTALSCDSPYLCRTMIPLNKLINPYYAGMLGNWRVKSQYAYQVDRETVAGMANQFGGTNIRKSGAYSVFNPFWSYNSGTGIWEANPTNDTKWIEASRVTYYNASGTEIENRDALNRYSAALFGYIETLPVAVASNSRVNEIAYDGFEDYSFALGCNASDTCIKGQFNFKSLLGSAASLNTEIAHSGKSSLLLNGSVTLSKSVYNSNVIGIYSIVNGRYYLGSNELAKGFSPFTGKKYILSFWIKESNSRTPTTGFQASVNGVNLISNSIKWPVVEGWKRIEVPFLLSSFSTKFNLQLSSSGQAYVDDIRIYPYDGQMKTFSYDNSTLRLLGELDENNFATFYEYDDEGILIRVKKETERGIVTIKESRSYNRKTN